MLKQRFVRFAIPIFLLASFLFFGCVTPSPLYGKWVSINSDELYLSIDGTFSATIYINGLSEDFEGTWKQSENVLEFVSNGVSFNVPWTIDGSLFQLSWPTDTNGNLKVLEMYRQEAE